MKISLNWLKNYIDINQSPDKIAETLTNCGLEVESTENYQPLKGGLKGVVVGEVLTKEKHPDADKLSLTTVNIGNNVILKVVCGAPNVEAGQKVLLATQGTTIYKDEESFVIKKSKIRGQVSEGMICSEDELGLGKSHEGILVLDKGATVGMPAAEYLKIEEDIIFEIGLTPNRTDATSHIGVARDLQAVANCNKKNFNPLLKIPSVDNFQIDEISTDIKISLEDTQACLRYSGLTISGFKVENSPEWLKNRLKSIGIRPINNIVDITNFVMMETGQPLHAFDLKMIKGNKIIVKKLHEGTKFITLDGSTKVLSGNDLMICNNEEGMCLAGIYGGLNSGISENTNALFLESACFDAKTIRKSSRYHSLHTDSSFRFERGADPEITVYALKRAANLIKLITGAIISSDIIDVYPNPVKHNIINVNYDNIQNLIGKKIDEHIIKIILQSLGITIIKEDGKNLTISTPLYKADVTREADIIEELLRIYGYNNIELPKTVKLSLQPSPQPAMENFKNLISDYLSGNGFYEIYCNSLSKDYSNTDNAVKLLNPISKELCIMRQSLIYGGLETIIYNHNRKQQNLKLYEFGNVYQYKKDENKLDKYSQKECLGLFLTGINNKQNWNEKSKPVDYFNLKYYINNILLKTGLNLSLFKINKFSESFYEYGLSYDISGKPLIKSGLINKDILHLFDIDFEVYYAEFDWFEIIKLASAKSIKYKELPKYPEVKRDIAMLIDKDKVYSEIEKIVFEQAKNLITNVSLFDIYEGDKIEKSKKSYAVSITLQSAFKTLTDQEVDKIINNIKDSLSKNLGATIR